MSDGAVQPDEGPTRDDFVTRILDQLLDLL
jgi:hypothetical protein